MLNSCPLPENHPAITQGYRMMHNRRAFLQRKNKYKAQICMFWEISRGPYGTDFKGVQRFVRI